MKKRWQEWRTVVVLCIGLGWWGFWCPELERAADVYAIVWEDGTVQNSSEVIECELNGQSIWELQDVERSQIKISSRLWKLLQEYWEEEKAEQ